MRHCLGSVCGLLALVSCAGPQPLDVAIQPAHRQAYYDALIAHDHDPAAAHLAMMAEHQHISPDQLQARDQELSTTANPFDAHRDPVAVSRGAVIYEMHCMSCHGKNADGMGPMALPDHRPKDLHSFGNRLACTLHRGAPRSWFKKISNGYGEACSYPDGPGSAMPAFGHKLTREQIWLVITYLQSLDIHAPSSDSTS